MTLWEYPRILKSLLCFADDEARLGRLLQLRVGQERAAAGDEARPLRLHIRISRHGRIHHRRHGTYGRERDRKGASRKLHFSPFSGQKHSMQYVLGSPDMAFQVYHISYTDWLSHHKCHLANCIQSAALDLSAMFCLCFIRSSSCNYFLPARWGAVISAYQPGELPIHFFVKTFFGVN